MATFAVKIVSVRVESHHNADALEIARIGGYCSVVRKGAFADGDLVAYIPEQAILPVVIIEELGLTGRLAGSKANRVKAIRLRGVLSQGICYPARAGWALGQDVTEVLGIVKYEPPVPTSMSGLVYGAGLDRTIRYDVENIKRYPDVLAEGEAVVFTEKVHGTWAQLGLVSPQMADPENGRLVVSSKGYASRGLAFVNDAPENATNLYRRIARHLDIAARIDRVFGTTGESVFVLGEVFGRGVQDLAYGASAASDEKLGFRVFDIYIGDPGIGRYLDDAALSAAVEAMGLSRVPVLYRGPFTAAVLAEHTSGRESISGRGEHIREGVVVRPAAECRHQELGRVQLKSINPKYLVRKRGTEFN